jgi:hypothetical protein
LILSTLLLLEVQAEGRMLAVAVAQADTEPMFLVQHLAVEVRQKPFLALLEEHPTQLQLAVEVLVVLLTLEEQLVKIQFLIQSLHLVVVAEEHGRVLEP